MTGAELLLLGLLAVFVLVPGPAFLFDVGYYRRHGYVPVGWRKRDRILRSERPVYFWILTKGRLVLLGLVLALDIVLLLLVLL